MKCIVITAPGRVHSPKFGLFRNYPRVIVIGVTNYEQAVKHSKDEVKIWTNPPFTNIILFFVSTAALVLNLNISMQQAAVLMSQFLRSISQADVRSVVHVFFIWPKQCETAKYRETHLQHVVQFPARYQTYKIICGLESSECIQVCDFHTNICCMKSWDTGRFDNVGYSRLF